jgi:hypothetical protein
VARIDFDQLDLPAFSRWPWLILPLLAEQLWQQLPRGKLWTFSRQYKAHGEVLRHWRGDAGITDLRKQLAQSAKSLEKEVVDFFGSALGQEPVLVILDTLEEPLLHHKAALQKVLDLYGKVRKDCPQFRVVLSGRYSIQDRGRLPAVAKQLEAKAQITYERVNEFSPDESLRFMRALRGVKRDNKTLMAVHEVTAGNPLELALFAELLQADSSINSPAKVREVKPVFKFAYLLDRIIQRIPESQSDVRWLLRYAVIPRRLTREFLDDVLADYLGTESSGTTQLDAPHKFDGELKRFSDRKPWPYTTKLRVNRAWEGLRNYAGSASWVGIEEDAIRLQPEVVGPMRVLLREQSDEMFALLHREAAAYFEVRAAREKDRWAEHIAEAIYHRFQIEGKGAIPYWLKQLADRRSADPAARERIAGLVLGSEFLDDETRQPLLHPRAGVMIDRSACARGAFEVAWSASIQRCLMT